MSLIQELGQEAQRFREGGLLSAEIEQLIPKWQRHMAQEPRRFLRSDGAVDAEALQNFRRLQLFIPDTPNWDPQRITLKNLLGGGRRGERRMLKECLDVFRATGDENLLRKYPCHPAGNPYVFSYQSHRYTYRWLKHVYFLSLFKRVLEHRLASNFISLDIGSSYGIFSSLLKREYPSSHHVLVDFAEPLLLARYFLNACVPGCRIAGLQEMASQASLSREFLQQYDFVLLPCAWYAKLAPGSVDVVMNFAALGEMTREWFDRYLQAPVFTTARYFFTANRIQSQPTYDTDLTILDYPIWDLAKRLHFGVSPLFSQFWWSRRRHLIFYERITSPPYFDYIGAIT